MPAGYGTEEDSDSADERPKYLTRIQPTESQQFSRKRDILDNLLTYVNRDLLICKLFYFFFFAAFGSLFPLLAVYFKQLGMSATQSGILIGFRPFLEFCSAPLWGGLADRWKKGKQLFMFSIFSWIVFSLAIAFVKPPKHSCIQHNDTVAIPQRGYPSKYNRYQYQSGVYNPSEIKQRYPVIKKKAENVPKYQIFQEDQTSMHPLKLGDVLKVLPVSEKPRPSGKKTDTTDLVHPPYTTVVYKKDEVQNVFFILLLLVVFGEFFSAPAITFADSVTLSYLGEDTDNYGKQRMFGSLGWALSMFFVGLVLDHSTTFPNHPCEVQHYAEKNYTVCFAVFSVLMSCAFITATQFRFANQDSIHSGQFLEYFERAKDFVKSKLTGQKIIDRKRLVEEDSDYEEFGRDNNTLSKNARGTNSAFDKSEINPNFQDKKDNLQIKLDNKHDMVDDAVKTQGANKYELDDQKPFLGDWFTVIRLLGTYKYISVLFLAWFMGFGIGLIFTFLFWYLQDLGGSPTLFGVASVINHISELLAYFLSSRFIAQFGHMKVLYAGLVGNIVRFLYISWLRNPWWVLPFEFVQGLSHAAVWASCCSYIIQAIPVTLRSSAQGILQGLHHGLGRGCGAVFGGIIVSSYGSEVAFRSYGVTCVIIFVALVVSNYFLQDRGYFSHGVKGGHEVLEDNCHLAPQGVPSGMARDLSSSRLKEKEEHSMYGTVGDSSIKNNLQPDNSSYNQGYQSGPQRLLMNELPAAPTQIYQQQPHNNYDQFYGP